MVGILSPTCVDNSLHKACLKRIPTISHEAFFVVVTIFYNLAISIMHSLELNVIRFLDIGFFYLYAFPAILQELPYI